jgi:hypothetical protein
MLMKSPTSGKIIQVLEQMIVEVYVKASSVMDPLAKRLRLTTMGRPENLKGGYGVLECRVLRE